MPASSPRSSPAPSLRAAGLRQTSQREALLRVLAQADRPLSAEEIRSRMLGKRSGLPTIYRNLGRFVAEGWAETLLAPDQTMRFVRCHSRRHHHHLQCEACGRTVEVDGCGMEGMLEGIESSTGFRVTRHQLQIFGRCPDCRR
jgi:Fur family transcriptional regulator, ferric uptake regulator